MAEKNCSPMCIESIAADCERCQGEAADRIKINALKYPNFSVIQPRGRRIWVRRGSRYHCKLVTAVRLAERLQLCNALQTREIPHIPARIGRGMKKGSTAGINP